MARVTSPRPSSRHNVTDQPRKLFIRISADKMRWYKNQEAREREASRPSTSSSPSTSPRRLRISLKRRESS
ncbi:hypothetical protein KVR01_010891 [Diaporthe batatas]|uniref:uncharacterized protein n=1 Tax=Diaporthe batatas TaxID=748121 RepID=UPI001D0553CB|nr:uncharacterized protein KVR01_010891 [Diaporthe batatas]KAG8159230.1 hypothetical protein KVR01_010891 [Diaporthe batatas]